MIDVNGTGEAGAKGGAVAEPNIVITGTCIFMFQLFNILLSNIKFILTRYSFASVLHKG